MKIGIIGLGKMGSNLALNMKDQNIDVIGYNRSPEKSLTLQEQGLNVAFSIDELIDKLDSPKILWLMIPSGKYVDDMIQSLLPKLSKGDIIIDAGNSNYNDTIARGKSLESAGIKFMDVGTSGGTGGARNGACMMVGGEKETFEYIKPVIEKVCVKDGYSYFGQGGSGHFVKMIHNGIEYGMMQSIGEGFEILKESEFDLDFEEVSKVWNNGSIIESYLMQMTLNAFANSPVLEELDSVVDSSGEGLWTVETALKLGVPAPTITTALFERYRTKKKDSFSAKVIAAQRNQFGGHDVHKK